MGWKEVRNQESHLGYVNYEMLLDIKWMRQIGRLEM